MKHFYAFIGVLEIAVGLYIFFEAVSAVQEIEGILFMLMGSIFVIAAEIVESRER